MNDEEPPDDSDGIFGPLALLSDEDLQLFCSCGKRRELERDEEILRQGQHNGSLFIVLEGMLQALGKIDGRDIILARLQPGNFFGEISLFDPGPVTATVRAASPSVLVEIRRPHLDEFITLRPAAGATILLALLEDMAVRFRKTDSRLQDIVNWGRLAE